MSSAPRHPENSIAPPDQQQSRSNSEPSSEKSNLISNNKTDSSDSNQSKPTFFEKVREAVRRKKTVEKSPEGLLRERDVEEGKFCDCLVMLMHRHPRFRGYLSPDTIAEISKNLEDEKSAKKKKKRGSGSQSALR